jgi:hypothetical protein
LVIAEADLIVTAKSVILMIVKREISVSSPDSASLFNEGNVQPPQGLLLTGEGLASMTQERLAMLGQIVGGLGLQVTVVHDLERLPEPVEREPEPVPACFRDFLDFASEHNYTERRASKAWGSLLLLSSEHRNPTKDDQYPRIRLIRNADFRQAVIDMRSVYRRMVASSLTAEAWEDVDRTLPFLIDVVNAFVQPDEPLSFEPTPRKHADASPW